MLYLRDHTKDWKKFGGGGGGGGEGHMSCVTQPLDMVSLWLEHLDFGLSAKGSGDEICWIPFKKKLFKVKSYYLL
jgi:hypothetical protein